MKNPRHLPLLFLPFVLIACDELSSPKTGSCSDPQTVQTVQEIFLKSVLEAVPTAAQEAPSPEQEVKKRFPVAVETIRTTSVDEKVGKYSCAAELKITAPHSPLQQLASNPLLKSILGDSSIKFNGNEATATINYTSHITDDRKQIMVQITGHAELAQYVALSLAVLRSIPASTTSQSSSTESTVPTPPPAAASQSTVSRLPEPPAASAPNGDECSEPGSMGPVTRSECLKEKFQSADTALNEAYRAQMANLEQSRKTELRESQRAWLSGKTKQCGALEQSHGEEATDFADRLSCHLKMTRQRTDYLQSYK